MEICDLNSYNHTFINLLKQGKEEPIENCGLTHTYMNTERKIFSIISRCI